MQHTVDYLRDSFRSLRDGAILVDQNGLIEWSNTSAQRLLGLRYPQDKGQNVLSLVRYPDFSSYLLAGNYQEPCVVKSTGYPATHFQVEISSFGAGDRLILVRDITRFVQIEQTRQDFVGNVSHELRTPLTVITGFSTHPPPTPPCSHLRCKPWCLDNYPHYYPELSGVALEEPKMWRGAGQATPPHVDQRTLMKLRWRP